MSFCVRKRGEPFLASIFFRSAAFLLIFCLSRSSFLLVLEHFTFRSDSWKESFLFFFFKVRYPSSFQTIFFVSLLLPVFFPSLRKVSSHQYLVSFDEIVFFLTRIFSSFSLSVPHTFIREEWVSFFSIFSFILSHRLFSGKER